MLISLRRIEFRQTASPNTRVHHHSKNPFKFSIQIFHLKCPLSHQILTHFIQNSGPNILRWLHSTQRTQHCPNVDLINLSPTFITNLKVAAALSTRQRCRVAWNSNFFSQTPSTNFYFLKKKKYFVKTKNHRFLRFEFPPKRPICSGVNKQFKFHDSSEAICASGTSVALCCAASHLMASFVSPKSSRHLTVRRPKSNEPVDKQFTPRPLWFQFSDAICWTPFHSETLHSQKRPRQVKIFSVQTTRRLANVPRSVSHFTRQKKRSTNGTFPPPSSSSPKIIGSTFANATGWRI